MVKAKKENPQSLALQGFAGLALSFPLIFEFLLWLIYALNIIQNGDFGPVFACIISFIKISVAENVAKSFVG